MILFTIRMKICKSSRMNKNHFQKVFLFIFIGRCGLSVGRADIKIFEEFRI